MNWRFTMNYTYTPVPYKKAEDGTLFCPVCNSKLRYVYNVHDDGLYSLQCPNDAYHCYRKNKVTEFEIETGAYKDAGLNRCNVCNRVLRYNPEGQELICPTDATHCSPIPISDTDYLLKGYNILTKDN